MSRAGLAPAARWFLSLSPDMAVPVAWTPHLPVWCMACGRGQWEKQATGQGSCWDGLEAGRPACGSSPKLGLWRKQGLPDSLQAQLPWPLVGRVGLAAPEAPLSFGEDDLKAHGGRDILETRAVPPYFSGPFTLHLSPAPSCTPTSASFWALKLWECWLLHLGPSRDTFLEPCKARGQREEAQGAGPCPSGGPRAQSPPGSARLARGAGEVVCSAGSPSRPALWSSNRLLSRIGCLHGTQVHVEGINSLRCHRRAFGPNVDHEHSL